MPAPKFRYSTRATGVSAKRTATIHTLTEDDIRRSKILPHAHLEMMWEGHGLYVGWNLIALRCNTGQYVANKHFQEQDAQMRMSMGLRALALVHQRYQLKKSLKPTAGEYLLIGEALCLVDELQDTVARAEWSEATQYILRIAGIIH